jgi:Flp pilus assembly pilin Flp
MRGPIGHVGRPERAGRGVRAVRALLRLRRVDGGAAAVEFALLTTLVATVTFAAAAVIGAEIGQPLESLTAVLGAIAGTNG